MLKIKQVGKTSTYKCSHGLYFFTALKVAGGIDVTAKLPAYGQEFKLQAKSIAEAERKIAAFIEACRAEIDAERKIKRAEFDDFHAKQAQATCAHDWVEAPVKDHLNIVSHSKCSKCGEHNTIPRSN